MKKRVCKSFPVSLPVPAVPVGARQAALAKIGAKTGAKTRALWHRDEGSATIEVVLWLPFLMALFTLIVDTSVMFHNHTKATQIVQDASRGFSVGRYESSAETQTELLSRLSYLSGNATAVTTLNAGVIDTVVTIPASDLDLIGIFEGLKGFTFTIRAQHLQEV